MVGNTRTRPIEIMFRHLPALRGYASRVLIGGEALSNEEERDRLERLAEFMTIGGSLNWTEREIVSLLLREVFASY